MLYTSYLHMTFSHIAGGGLMDMAAPFSRSYTFIQRKEVYVFARAEGTLTSSLIEFNPEKTKDYGRSRHQVGQP